MVQYRELWRVTQSTYVLSNPAPDQVVQRHSAQNKIICSGVRQTDLNWGWVAEYGILASFLLVLGPGMRNLISLILSFLVCSLGIMLVPAL